MLSTLLLNIPLTHSTLTSHCTIETKREKKNDVCSDRGNDAVIVFHSESVGM